MEIRRVARGETAALGGLLARAFHDDPGYSWAAPNPRRRRMHAPRYFQQLVDEQYVAKGETYVGGDGASVAMWAPPGAWLANVTDSLRLAPVMAKACTTNLPTAIRMALQIETQHKRIEAPHYYLGYLATEPAHQGKGLGSALISDMLNRLDDEGVGSYLESASPGNRALYLRHGYVELSEQRWPRGGPPWWPMWRAPR